MLLDSNQFLLKLLKILIYLSLPFNTLYGIGIILPFSKPCSEEQARLCRYMPIYVIFTQSCFLSLEPDVPSLQTTIECAVCLGARALALEDLSLYLCHLLAV